MKNGCCSESEGDLCHATNPNNNNLPTSSKHITIVVTSKHLVLTFSLFFEVENLEELLYANICLSGNRIGNLLEE